MENRKKSANEVFKVMSELTLEERKKLEEMETENTMKEEDETDDASRGYIRPLVFHIYR